MRLAAPLAAPALALTLGCGDTGAVEPGAEEGSGDATGETGGPEIADCEAGEWSAVPHPDAPPILQLSVESDVALLLHPSELAWWSVAGVQIERAPLPDGLDPQQVLGVRALGAGGALLVRASRVDRWDGGQLLNELAIDPPARISWSDGRRAVGRGVDMGPAMWRRGADGLWTEATVPQTPHELVHHAGWSDGTEAVLDDSGGLFFRAESDATWTELGAPAFAARIAAAGDPDEVLVQADQVIYRSPLTSPTEWTELPLPAGLVPPPASLGGPLALVADDDQEQLHALQWTGDAWSDTPLPAGLTVAGAHLSHPFLAAHRFVPEGPGQLWYAAGGVVSAISAPDNLCGGLLGAEGAPDGSAWAHAEQTSRFSPLVRFDGARWQTAAARQVVEIAARGDGSVIAIDSSGQLFRTTPAGEIASLSLPPDLVFADWTLWTDGLDRTWVFGTGFDMGRRTCPWKDGAWGECRDAPSALELKTFPIAARGALGLGDDAGLSFFDGESWSRVPQPEPPLVGAGVSSVVWQGPDAVWISDDERVTHWDGERWSEVTEAPPGELAPDGALGVWLVDHEGGSLWHFDRQSWTEVAVNRFSGLGWDELELWAPAPGAVTVYTCESTETFECE